MRTNIYLSIGLATLLLLSGCGSSATKSSDKMLKNQKTLTQSLNPKIVAKKSANKKSIQPVIHAKKGFRSATIYKPSQISIKSHNSYNQNQRGIITSSTLTKWIDNWQENKPQGVNGRLIILQAGVTRFDDNKTFLPHNDKDVFVYAIPGAGSCDPSYTRFDGFSNTPGAMITGKLVDRNINAFQINPKKDFVVVAMSQGSVGIRELIRTMWSMIYWGWDLNKIAFLNGSIEYNFINKKDYLVAKSSPIPKLTHTYHMSDLKTDRTSLHIYIDEMKKIASSDQKGIFLADLRGTKEYTGAKKSATKTKTCGSDHKHKCYSAFRGHIRGAVDFPYTDMIVMDDERCDLNKDGKIDKLDASYKLKSPQELKELYACKGYKPGDTVVAYCRTGRKATLAAITSTLILGYPFRMYDGSWMQWGEMADSKDTNLDQILDENSPARLDTPKYSCVAGYNNPIDIEPKSTYKINENSKSAQQIKKEDQAYLQK